MTEEQIIATLDAAEKRWKKAGARDSFTTRMSVPEDAAEPRETVNVMIYHHETFPMGGRTYTADLRNMPEPGAPAGSGKLIRRSRFSRV